METRPHLAAVLGATLLVVGAISAQVLTQHVAAIDLRQTGSDCAFSGEPSFDDRANQVLCLILAGRFADVRAQFDATMLAALSEEQLADAWRGYLDIFGEFESAGRPTSLPFGANIVEQVPVRMARSEGEIRVTFNPDGTIAGLFFLRPGIPIR